MVGDDSESLERCSIKKDIVRGYEQNRKRLNLSKTLLVDANRGGGIVTAEAGKLF